MKQFLKRLMLSVVTLAMFCCVTPLAFADNPNYYTIYLERQGGIGTPEYVFVYRIKTSDGTENYRISRLPTPTMEGYTFKGWFTDIVDGSAIVAGETVFSGEEATVYAQWSPIDQVPTESTAPADTAAGILERHKGTILIVGGMLVLVAVGLAM